MRKTRAKVSAILIIVLARLFVCSPGVQTPAAGKWSTGSVPGVLECKDVGWLDR